MEFKFKIDLSSQVIIDEKPFKGKKKKKANSDIKEKIEKSKINMNIEIKNVKEGNSKKKDEKIFEKPRDENRKKKKSSTIKNTKSPTEIESEKPKINTNSIISFAMPNTDIAKGDQAQKLNMLMKKKPRHWENRWVMKPNVFEFSKEIWIKKWVVVDEGDEISDINYLPHYYSNYAKSFKDSTPKKYQCSFDECGKIFLDSSSLRKHLLTHGERHYICKHDGCGKKFLDNSKLRRHQLVHTGEKPFKCELCQKKFSLDFNLKTHLRTHTGEKPYICSFPNCEKRFTQSSNLTAHEKIHKELSASQKTENEGKGNGTNNNPTNDQNSQFPPNGNGKIAIFTSIKQEEEACIIKEPADF